MWRSIPRPRRLVLAAHDRSVTRFPRVPRLLRKRVPDRMVMMILAWTRRLPGNTANAGAGIGLDQPIWGAALRIQGRRFTRSLLDEIHRSTEHARGDIDGGDDLLVGHARRPDHAQHARDPTTLSIGRHHQTQVLEDLEPRLLADE